MEKNILEEIYRRYTGQVYLYLYSLCHNREIAEDLMQETFLKALCTVEMQSDAILPWLLRVGRNLFIDMWRREKHLTEEPEEDRIADDAEEILDQLITKEQNRRLYEAIQKLKGVEREAVVLYYFTGLAQEKIASQLEMSYGNVRVVLHRAKKKLRQMLEEMEEMEGR